LPVFSALCFEGFMQLSTGGEACPDRVSLDAIFGVPDPPGKLQASFCSTGYFQATDFAFDAFFAAIQRLRIPMVSLFKKAH